MLILLAPPETELEANKIWVGNSDSKLSQNGREIARELGRHDMWINPQRIYVAPAEHLIEFANILYPLIPHIQAEEFTDRSMGTLTGRDYRETMAEFPRRNWLAWQRSYWSAPPEGESLFDISDRVLTAFRTKVLPIPSAENVLIICSRDVMRLIIGYMTKMEETEIPKISVEPVVPYVVNGPIGCTD